MHNYYSVESRNELVDKEYSFFCLGIVYNLKSGSEKEDKKEMPGPVDFLQGFVVK
ncbi:hypothetical protein YSY43_28850 [Paenibacillus sp. YSY-4.3]